MRMAWGIFFIERIINNCLKKATHETIFEQRIKIQSEKVVAETNIKVPKYTQGNKNSIITITGIIKSLNE